MLQFRSKRFDLKYVANGFLARKVENMYFLHGKILAIKFYLYNFLFVHGKNYYGYYNNIFYDFKRNVNVYR